MSNSEGMTQKEKMAFRQRCGRVVFDARMVADNPEIAMKICGKLMIVRAEYLAMFDKFEYHAYSPHFRILTEGEVTPEYTVEVTITDDNEEVTFKEVKNGM